MLTAEMVPETSNQDLMLWIAGSLCPAVFYMVGLCRIQMWRNMIKKIQRIFDVWVDRYPTAESIIEALEEVPKDHDYVLMRTDVQAGDHVGFIFESIEERDKEENRGNS